MKRLVVGAPALALLLLAAGCSPEAPPAENITLGAVLPLTGEASLYGTNTRKGIDLAIEQANADGGVNGQMVEVVYEDSRATARDGVTGAQKLLSQHDVPVIFDDAVSSVALAVLPVIHEAGVVMISSGSTNPSLSGASPFFFRTWNSDSEEGRFSALHARDALGMERGAGLFVDNDYGRGLYDVFKANFEGEGGKMVAFETFLQADSDFRDQILKLRDADAEFIYLISYPEKIPQILQQMRQYEVSQRVIGTVTMEDPEIPAQAGEAAEGVLFPYPVDPSGQAVESFNAAYSAKYGEDPGICTHQGYDNAQLVIAALRDGARSGAEIAEALRKVREWPGASGPITFDENGDVHKPMAMKEIRGGKFIVLGDATSDEGESLDEAA